MISGGMRSLADSGVDTVDVVVLLSSDGDVDTYSVGVDREDECDG